MGYTYIMKDSRLFHRLGPPSKSLLGAPNPFTFGAGTSGLTDDAARLLAPIFSFEYMMKAQFEDGGVQRALFRIHEQAESFEAFVMDIPQTQVARHWREEVRSRTKEGKPRKRYRGEEPKPDTIFKSPAKVFVLCHKDEKTTVENNIRLLAMNRYKMAIVDVDLHCRLRPMEEYDKKVVGWLELDNGYFFFVNEEAWKKTVELFKGQIPQTDARIVPPRTARETSKEA